MNRYIDLMDDRRTYEGMVAGTVQQADLDMELVGAGNVAGVERWRHIVRQGDVFPVASVDVHDLVDLGQTGMHIAFADDDGASRVVATQVVCSDLCSGDELDLQQLEVDCSR